MGKVAGLAWRRTVVVSVLSGAVLAVGVAQAQAVGPPIVETTAASAVTQTTATLNATVNPNGSQVIVCGFEISHGSSVPCSTLPGSGNSPVAVSAQVTGLVPNTTYNFRITATNAAGTSKGGELKFTTLLPTPVTVAASSVGDSAATLNATVNPHGGGTECKFEYGITTEYGSGATACRPAPGSGTGPVAVSAEVTGLLPNTTYHFRISMTNSGGTSRGSDEMFTTLAGCTPEGFCTTFARESLEEGFAEPLTVAVAVDPSGNIWVADSGNDRVLEFNSKREYVRQFGSEGTGPGQFSGNRGFLTGAIGGIATDALGDVYVSGSGRVQEFSSSGMYLTSFGSPGSGNGQFHDPTGIAVDSSGDVWVLDTFNYRVQEFSPSGEYLSQFGSEGSENGQLGWASGLAFSGGHLYVSEFANNRVQEFSTSGTYLGQFGSSGSANGQFHGPLDVASSPSTGNLYVSSFNRIQEFSPEGNFIATFGSTGSGAGQFFIPRGLAVNSSGGFYVADTANNRVQEWVTTP